MTLDKAIEILTLQSKEPNTPPNIDTNFALILGIGALKYIIRLRAFSIEHRPKRLPGETED